MVITKQAEDRINALESVLIKRKNFITLLLWSNLLLKRDLANNKIQLLQEGDDEYEKLQMEINDVIMIDLLCTDDWSEIRNSKEKLWILEHLNKGKSAYESWQLEAKAYKKALRESKKYEPIDKPSTVINHNDKPIPIPIPHKPYEDPNKRMERIKEQIAKDFADCKDGESFF
jgi:hypothetical protein